MPIFSSPLGSFSSTSFLSASNSKSDLFPFVNFPHKLTVKSPLQWHYHQYHPVKVFDSGNTHIDQNPDSGILQRPLHTPIGPQDDSETRRNRKLSDWKTAKAYKDSGLIYNGRVEAYNSGGMLIRFYSIFGFLPYPLMSPMHAGKVPGKSVQEIAKSLVHSTIPVKVIVAEEKLNKLVFSEKEAVWAMYSKEVNIGDIFEGVVSYVEDYGAFVHLRFPDGLYHLTGLIHISELSWDLIQDVNDILKRGDTVRVKVIGIDGHRFRINLSLRQLEEDPLLQTLDKVILEDGSDSMSDSDSAPDIEPLPGLETIIEELQKEDGIYNVTISRQGFEKRVVSPDLQIWLSNAPPVNQRFTLLARAGRQVQEIHLLTSLNQEGIKETLQRVLDRVP